MCALQGSFSASSELSNSSWRKHPTILQFCKTKVSQPPIFSYLGKIHCVVVYLVFLTEPHNPQIQCDSFPLVRWTIEPFLPATWLKLEPSRRETMWVHKSYPGYKFSVTAIGLLNQAQLHTIWSMRLCERISTPNWSLLRPSPQPITADPYVSTHISPNERSPHWNLNYTLMPRLWKETKVSPTVKWEITLKQG